MNNWTDNLHRLMLPTRPERQVRPEKLRVHPWNGRPLKRQREREPQVAKEPKVPQGHNLCECGKWKNKHGRSCFACEDKDLAFAELDLLIAANVSTPRGRLEGWW